MSKYLHKKGDSLSEVDSVIEELLDCASPTPSHLEVKLEESSGKYLAKDIRSQLFLPPVATSAMDGFAIQLDSIAVGQRYRVSDRIPAGVVGKPLDPKTVVRIFTGAPMPQGSDSVVIQENTSSKDKLVTINKLPSFGENVRPRGQDVKLSLIHI